MDGYVVAAVAEPTVGIVVFTGVSLVFLILVLIMFLIKIQGVLFEKIEQRTKKQKLQPPVQTHSSNIPQAEPEISAETVAVIAAAVAAMEGGYQICEIKKHKPSVENQSASAWAQAGRNALTTPFRR